MKKSNLLLWIGLAIMVIGTAISYFGYTMYSDPLSFMGGQTWNLVEFYTRAYEIKYAGYQIVDVGFVTMIIGGILAVVILVNNIVNDIVSCGEVA